MASLLPQQQLVLELLRMSGEIAVTEQSAPTILWRTIEECRAKGWLTVTRVSPGVHAVLLTNHGRRTVESASTD
ncbi:hypothetical protein HBA54_07255 [Pelagibius litoralis]|uniref:Uncharacterized protein n=1 Tax=Pelagibius litoralis TaxID=374515 RepID=A0A967C202_9PROT|nr:hypothetical protein [Pelagibius litoralis]NIA68386.1 hypothetical protein [Pelagibius litoralis]